MLSYLILNLFITGQMQQELQHTGGMARSHNILANETVHALSYMTAQVKRYAVFVC